MTFRIAILPGDGIGPEVARAAVRMLGPVRDFCSCQLEIEEHPIGAAALCRGASPLPVATLDACLAASAVFLGAVGAPEFESQSPARRPEAGLLELRQALGGFANLRPARVYPSLLASSPLRSEIARGVDILIVRELLGGLYFGVPRGFASNGCRTAFNTMSYSEEQIARVAEVAFRQARMRRRKVTSVDKANVLETSRLWREVVTGVGQRYPEVELEHLYVDACATALMVQPARFDVILTENLFGDILSDQAAGIAGSLGLLPSATLGGAVDLFEPVHGSAPNLAGTGLANPAGAILSMAMLLRHALGLEREAADLETAVEQVWQAGYRTADLAGHSACVQLTTEGMAERVEQAFVEILDRRYAYHAV